MNAQRSAVTLDYEIRFGRNAGAVICGVDEVGRGPIAGPVVAAAVVLPPKDLPESVASRINDSKKLSMKQRESLFDPITDLCRCSVAEASVAEITELNILNASLLAMRRAVEGLPETPHMALIDGNRSPKLGCKTQIIIGGDGKSLSIAAASIIAKVVRDRLMRRLSEEYPGYGWDKNAGYPTAEHLDAIKRIGITAWHRPSFAPVAQMIAAAA